MTAPFDRRDSACAAIVAGLVAGGGALTYAPAAPLLAVACVGLAVLVMGLSLRTLPPDLRLRPMIGAAARQAAAPLSPAPPSPAPPSPAPPWPALPSQAPARLRVAVLPEALGWYRLDLQLDDVRVAQLRPGTAVVLPMPPGAHVLTVRLWLWRLGGREMINALPGTDTDIAIRGSGGRSRQYSIERRDLASVLADRRIVLVQMPVPGTALSRS